MTTALPTESQILSGLSRILPSLIPRAEVSEIRREVFIGNLRIDLAAKVRIGRVTKIYLMEVKSSGEPRYVYEGIGKLLLVVKKVPKAYPVMIVPSMSTEGKELCKQANVGYIALNGDLFLRYATISYEHSFRESPITAVTILRKRRTEQKIKSLAPILEQVQRSLRQRRQPFPFSAKGSRVLRIFLENPKRSWTIAQVAQEAQVNPRLALLAINYLADKLLIKKDRGATTLLKPKELLDLWVSQYGFKKNNQILGFYSAARTFEEFLQGVRKLPQESQDKYALTLYTGTSLVAPYLRFSENHLYVQGNAQKWADQLGLKPTESGANTFLVLPYDSSVFYKTQKIQGISVVSNVQLYLDLYNFNDRAREQAEVLYKKAIDFK